MYGIKRVRVSGCEPTLNLEHLLPIIRMAVSDGYDYVLDTNGVHLTEDFLEAIKPLRDKVYIYMGLKGSTPELFEKTTTVEAKYWYNQLEALRLVVKHGFTLGVNVMANFTPPETLGPLFDTLRKISPILPACVDMKRCSYFMHNLARINRYELVKYKPADVNQQWNWLLMKHYEPSLIGHFQLRESRRAFERRDLESLQDNIEFHNGLKFVMLPRIPFEIPFADHALVK